MIVLGHKSALSLERTFRRKECFFQGKRFFFADFVQEIAKREVHNAQILNGVRLCKDDRLKAEPSDHHLFFVEILQGGGELGCNCGCLCLIQSAMHDYVTEEIWPFDVLCHEVDPV